MNAYQREKKLAEEIQRANSRINHLSSLMKDVSQEVEKCKQAIAAASQKLKELHNEHGTD